MFCVDSLRESQKGRLGRETASLVVGLHPQQQESKTEAVHIIGDLKAERVNQELNYHLPIPASNSLLLPARSHLLRIPKPPKNHATEGKNKHLNHEPVGDASHSGDNR